MVDEKISVLIPVFNLKDERLDNFKYILGKLVESKITKTILVYEQRNKEKTDIEKICNAYKSVRYEAELIDDDRIHKSFLINEGVKKLDTEFVWINDADCYLKFKKVYDIITLQHKSAAAKLNKESTFVPEIESILDTYDFIQPFAIAKRLSEEETIKLRNNESIDVDFSDKQVEANKEDFIKLYGALSFIFRKSTFLKIGGMDEAYTGWGLEDTDFCAQVYKFCTSDSSETSNIKILRIMAAVHLYHPMPSFDDRKNNCPIYNKNFKYFTDKHDMTYFKLKQLVEAYHKKRPQITIMNRPRTGSNCVKEALGDGLKITNESEAFSDRWRFRYDKDGNYEEAIEKIVSTQNIITHNLSTIDSKQLQFYSSQKFIEYSDLVILLTRKDFLDWITSMAVSLHENNYYGKQYKIEEKIQLEFKTFKYWFAMWYIWHVDEVPRYVDICKKNNIPVVVGDYNRLTKIEGIHRDILPHISNNLDKSLFKLSTIKQKTKKNSDYISNYDEIKSMYYSLRNREKSKLFTEIEIYIDKCRQEISKGMYEHSYA